MDSSIIVKNLPAGVYVPELCDQFRCFGCIVSASVQADKSKESTLEAYVAFDNTFSAFEAVKRMNKFKFRNRVLRVSMGNEDEGFTKVYVKNISASWDVCDLYKAFEDVGSIEDVKISEEKGRSNGYGYVVFENHSAARKAVERMNGRMIDGRQLKVERFKSKSERESMKQISLEHVEEILHKSAQPNNLHVKNIPADIAEDEFRKLFERYGEISSAKIMTDEKGVSRGFGFVSFTKEESAAKALKRMNGYTLRGKQLEINLKEDGQLRKLYTSLKNKARVMEMKKYRQRSQSVPKLYPGL